MRKAMYLAGFFIVVVSASVPVMAVYGVPTSAPEIDGGSIASGIGLLTGGMLMLRSRFGRK